MPVLHLKKMLNLSAGVLGLISMIMMHVYRLRHAGRVCSGSYEKEENVESPGGQMTFLDGRGQLFWVLLMIMWIIVGTCCLCAGVLLGIGLT